jgi:predicted transport protein
MSDIKLFSISKKPVTELQSQAVAIEKSLQSLVESELETFLGVRFLASEYSTGKVHGGRIDTLGIDENGCPVIIEYKRASNENVINQGLFYLDWLMDHKAEFELLVMKHLDKEDAEAIEWSSPRLICIAGDYTKYDQHAVSQINRNIELIRYRKYGDEFLLLELVNAVSVATTSTMSSSSVPASSPKEYKGFVQYLEQADQDLLDLLGLVTSTLEGFGDDVQVKQLKYYQAFKRIKNFACVEIQTGNNQIRVYAKVNPDSAQLEKGFTRDVSNIGHFGTGDLEITIKNRDDLTKALPLLEKSYMGS